MMVTDRELADALLKHAKKLAPGTRVLVFLARSNGNGLAAVNVSDAMFVIEAAREAASLAASILANDIEKEDE